jgi:hypothetical protein
MLSTRQGNLSGRRRHAALPTLLVFIACQNVILRGIVIPTFK